MTKIPNNNNESDAVPTIFRPPPTDLATPIGGGVIPSAPPMTEDDVTLPDAAPTAPTPQTIHAPPILNSKRTCRICQMEGDDTNDDPLIVPCQCTGWVHSRCLNRYRVLHPVEEFGQCKDCKFKYHMQPRETKEEDFDNTRTKQWNKVRMVVAISGDFLLVVLVIQILCVGFAALVWAMDGGHRIAAAMDGLESCVIENGEHENFFCSNLLSVYYAMGILCVCALIGFFYCCCSCWIQWPDPPQNVEQSNKNKTPGFYQSLRRKVSYENGCLANCEIAFARCFRKIDQKLTTLCMECKHSMVPCCSKGGWCGACFGDCCDSAPSSHHHHHHHHHHARNSRNRNDNGGGALGGVVLVLLVGLLVVFTVSGFVVAMAVLVVLIQRIVQRRVYMIHKRRLVKEFPVMDLFGEEAEDLEQARPQLDAADLQSLRKIGFLQ